MVQLKKLFALVITGMCLSMVVNICPVYAATKTITSYYSSGNMETATVKPDKEVTMYATVVCTDGSQLGHISQWKAKMYGELALACTDGACSFGKNGSKTDIMRKSYFSKAGKLITYTESADMFKYYKSASVTLYY